ncbi:MAG TPA: hypothetical protein VIT45_15755 [Allosphingosinicella sp.]
MNIASDPARTLRFCFLLGASGLALACASAARADSSAPAAHSGAAPAPSAEPAFAPDSPAAPAEIRLAAAEPQGPGGIIPPVIGEALDATADRRAADAAIARKWEALGRSPGAPVDGGEGGLIAVGDGFYREYSKAKDRIYYRPGGGDPLFVYGAIGDKYSALGGPAGWLGWPVAEEEDFADGGRAVTFQNGTVYWWSDTGAIDVGNVVVRYSGLHAFGETDNDSGSILDITGTQKNGDEPYVAFSVESPQEPAAGPIMTRVYEHVRPDSVRPDSVTLYQGPPRGAGITAVLFEQDFGNASAMRDKVKAAVQAAHVGGTGALTTAGPAGVVGAALLELGWEAYGEKLKDFIADAFDFEDDDLQTQGLFLSAKQMVVLSQTPKGDVHGIATHREFPMFSGEGGSWKLHVTVDAEPHANIVPAPVPAAAPRIADAIQSLWPTRQDIGRTQWGFADTNAVGWAQAGRAAVEICAARGFTAGHFTGHQDLGKGDFGLLCSAKGVVWRDAPAAEVAGTGWSFADVNQAGWAQAGRAAERLCAAAGKGYAGGRFNGHQAGGGFGLFCYGDGARWFDATDAELAATGFGFATPRLDDVPWAQAMRAAYGYCQGKGYLGGFMNGHQAPNAYGVVCEDPTAKPLGRKQVPGAGAPGAPPQPGSICLAAESARARNSPAAPGLERQCETWRASQN